MEEESLLKERLQAITDKRRIREDIRHKRRDIEEEKLKLQYIKKKSLREQWLMEGLQSEEEQETMKLQAQDELQRTTQLQTNIHRMEKEMEELEAEELNISANEEAILRRLKEVERTTEDIIKELSVDPLSEMSWPCPLPEDDLSDIFMETSPRTSALDQGPQEPKRATFAMEISVELDKRTGKAQVISTATVTPDIIQGKGLKVYEDRRKSVYALPPGGGGGVGAQDVSEMTPTDVEELLLQAIDWNGDVQYHQPVYAAPFTGTSRPSTPLASSKTTSPSLVHSRGTRTPNVSHSRAESRLEVCPELEESNGVTASYNMQTMDDISDGPYAMLGSITTSSESATTPTQTIHKNVETSPLRTTQRCELDVITKSMNRDRLSPSYINSSSMDKYAKSKTPSPSISCSESGIEDFQKYMEFDVIQTNNPQKNVGQTLLHVNDYRNLSSDEMSPIQTPFQIKESSLRVTHRYELDLIERSMNKYKTSPTETAKYHFSQSETPSPPPSHREPRIEFESKTTPTKSANTIEIYSDVRSARSDQEAALVSVRESSNGMPNPTRPVYRNVETSRPSPQGYGTDEINLDRNSPTCTESTAYSLLEELDPGAVTMIFMGYENVDEDEEDFVQAEVVVIGDSDEEEGLNMEENPSTIYHPNGCTSRVYQPLARDGRGYGEGLRRGGSLPHKPTFRHRAGKSALGLKDSSLQRSQKNFDRCVTDR